MFVLTLLTVFALVCVICLFFLRGGVGSFSATLPKGSWLGAQGGDNLKWRKSPPR